MQLDQSLDSDSPRAELIIALGSALSDHRIYVLSATAHAINGVIALYVRSQISL